MNVFSYSDSALSVIPPVLAIILAIVTRRVLLSLGAGILIGSLLLTNFSIAQAGQYLLGVIKALFWNNGAINTWNLNILLFIVLLGMITALITVSGSAQAFAKWAKERVRNKRDAKLMTMLLGMVIFIDDYFNSLVVGSVARPLTDRYYISRAKLAYLLDSTAAPVCVISPVSSWGAYIIALIGGILTTHGMAKTSYFGTFVEMIPMNFYAIFSLLLLLFVSFYGLDVGPMRRHENNAQRGDLYDESKGVPPGSITVLEEDKNGSVLGLFLPIATLVVATIAFMIVTGMQALMAEDIPFSLIKAFENTDVGLSLVMGALIGLVVTLFLNWRQGLPIKQTVYAMSRGARSMMPAVYILLFAWTIAAVIGELETGKYMASLATGNIPFALLPAVVFLLAGLTAFSTGTSWGTFGIMLPIAADMAMGSHSAMMLPMLAAVLSGAVFGDHCSPISDTTILSSTGASCHHIDHVTTQLPYALVAAGISFLGYLVMGFSESVMAGFLMCSGAFILALFFLKYLSEQPEKG
ncbi:Na+/H+ antiporter NhaC family protein [Parashewanella spongiae]|uniref:Na+/H+ antiporter NhaC family protein n=1 Tax=Parashewanella spongiae TaxID=342950 RepID=A0A3A6TQA1_9GAMM|nr:Na+/H+ antiporter NhaC family protein [Parashewanella spongiae]MCL1079863.1 Na+/H+ antiporter NhaC family protein [Parashewanella spongiae]RJY06755.1 Na+/H+ antiporter NhaC family protein [Parashewanella spongiae]